MTAAGSVGILATACSFPTETRSVADVFAAEGVELSDVTTARLGIDSVTVGDAEAGSELALDAARRALADAGLVGKDVHLIVDYTVLPQHFLVPVWNLGNKLQHELEATNAFTLGFSGGGTSSFHVALRFAADMIAANDRLRTALLFGADTAIPGNRVINPDDPVTVLGDGASAMVLSAEAERDVILGTELISDGAFHDVCTIPGGALAHLGQDDRADLYRLRIDTAKLSAAPTAATLERLGDAVAARTGSELSVVKHFVFPNLSAADDAMCRAVWDAAASPAIEANRRLRGHVQATDLVANLESVSADGACAEGDLLLVGSHGMGFTAGVTLLRH